MVVPDVEPKIVTSTNYPVKDQANPITGSTYTVVKGDYLWTIAVRAYGDGYKWVEIAKANNLNQSRFNFSGNVLKLPR